MCRLTQQHRTANLLSPTTKHSSSMNKQHQRHAFFEDVADYFNHRLHRPLAKLAPRPRREMHELLTAYVPPTSSVGPLHHREHLRNIALTETCRLCCSQQQLKEKWRQTLMLLTTAIKRNVAPQHHCCFATAVNREAAPQRLCCTQQQLKDVTPQRLCCSQQQLTQEWRQNATTAHSGS